MDSTKSSGRFPLRLPSDVDKQVRDLAQGKGEHPPAGINDTLVFLIKEGLKVMRAKERQAA